MSQFALWSSGDEVLIWSINVLLQVTWVAAIALMLGTAFRRSPAIRYWVLCSGLMLLLLCPVSVLLMQSSGFGLLSLSLPSEGHVALNAAQIEPQQELPQSMADAGKGLEIDRGTSLRDETNQPPNAEFRENGTFLSAADGRPADNVHAISPQPASLSSSLQDLRLVAAQTDTLSGNASAAPPVSAGRLLQVIRAVAPALLLVWFGIAGFLVVRLLAGWTRVLEILRTAKSTEDPRLDLAFQHACGALGVQPQVAQLRISNRIEGPIAAGLWRPTVVLPVQFAQRVTALQLHQILVHEVAHIVRHDQIVVLLQNVVSAIFWLHPLARRMNAQLAQAREEVCDNYVLAASDPPTYSRTLLAVAQMAGKSHPMLGTVGLFTSRWKLEQRVAGLLDRRRNRMTKLTLRGWCLVASSTLAVVAVASLATMTLAVPAVGGAESVVAQPEAAVERTTDVQIPEKIRVQGKVLRPDGSPAVGATVRAATPVWSSLRPVLGEDYQPPMSQTQTDEAGRFDIEFTTQPFGNLSHLDPVWRELWKKTTIAAKLDGLGPDWLSYEAVVDPTDLTLQLVEDHPVRGRVIDLEGKPIANVQIEVGGPRAGENNDISAWLTAIENGEVPWTVVKHLPRDVDPELIDVPGQLETDADGRFEIPGIGIDRVVSLVLESETVANETVTVVTRPMQATTRSVHTDESAKEQVFGATFDYTAAPARIVQGIVIDAETKEPLSGVTVESYKLANHFYVGGREISAETDAAGRFRLLGIAKGDGNILMIRPNDTQPYLMRRVPVPNPDGMGPVEVVAEVHRGIWITGKIVDRVTREPVPSTRVYYLPYRTNPYAQALPEFDSNGNVDSDQTRYQTDENGNYKLVGLPGPAVIGANSILKSYRRGVGYEQLRGPKHESGQYALTYRSPVNPGPKWPDVMREINPSEDTESVTLDLELDPGDALKVRVVDEAGQPVIGAQLRGLQQTNSAAIATADTAYAVVNLGDQEVRVLTVHHEQRNIGIVANIGQEQRDELTLELLPCATVFGRLLKNGEPLPGIAIRPAILPQGDFGPVLATMFTTDADGRFTGTLLPGCNYSLHGEGAGLDTYATIASDLEVQPGGAIDLGTLQLGDDRKFLPIRDSVPTLKSIGSSGPGERDRTGPPNAADASVFTPPLFATQPTTVNGVVLLPDGRPAADAKVFAGFPMSGAADRGLFSAEPIVTTAAEDGSFSVTYTLRALFVGEEAISNGAWRQIRDQVCVAATADGFGPDWRRASELREAERVELQLVPEVRLLGRLVSIDGTPAAGIKLDLKSIEAASQTNIAAWLSDIQGGQEIGQASRKHALRRLLPDLTGRQIEFSTNAKGEFAIGGIGQDQVARFVVSGASVAQQVVRLIGRDMQALSTNVVENHLEATTLYGARADAIIVTPSQPIVGTVRDTVSKQPLAGVAIETANFGGSRISGNRSEMIRVVSDEEGKFRLEGLPKRAGNRLLAVPNDDQPYFMREIDVPLQDGMQPITLDIELGKGVWIEGRVVDRETNQPVSAELKYLPFLDNPATAATPGFHTIGGGYMDGSFAYQARYQTRSDGSFRIVGLPGRAIVGAETHGWSSGRSYRRGVGSEDIEGMQADGSFATFRNPFAASRTFPNIMTEIDIDDGQAPFVVLRADPGIPVRIRVSDSSGKPITGFRVSGKAASSIWDAPEETSEFLVTGLAAEDERMLLIMHDQGGLGKAVRITPRIDRSSTLHVQLEPHATARGQILDENDAPIAHARLTALTQPLENYNARLDEITTDSQGRFEYTNIPPGAKYRIEGWSRATSMRRLEGIEFEAMSGQTIDFGVLQLSSDGKLEPSTRAQ